MGRIKSLLVKKAAKQLLNTDVVFSEKFEKNKKILGNNTMPSKPLRNKIAGYISRLEKMKRIQKPVKKIEIDPIQE
ncbi:30S ribosomal protein S17e [Candidatus Pacearchaeota archaeon CG10_big_fil_rev_8_21_14_0_10_31_24]|nr:MAG: 30S ribosomal protein S17e [Candidatus Pacearchaeota archaeon CG10_big_fil_rev_8_21_14_0_10_31_24]